jgi:MFS family permease
VNGERPVSEPPLPAPATTAPAEPGTDPVQRHVVRVLVAGQAVGAMGITIGLATASILARDLSGSDSLAGLAQTSQVFGTAIAAWWLARLMHARGRRVGLVVGLLTGALGGAIAVLSGVVGSVWLLLVGTLLIGATTAANNGARYAATDLARPEHRGRALAIVVWASTIGAVLGPNLVGVAGALADSLGLPRLTGPFLLGAVGMLVAAVVLAVRLRPDPLLEARAREAADTVVTTPTPGPTAAPASTRGPVVAVLRERPAVVAAIVGLASAHAVMVAVMVMTPLHMDHGGASLEVIGLVISVHVLGMFALAPVSGWIVDRFGRGTGLVLGGIVLLAAVALAGSSPEGESWRITIGLFLLGLGWSFATVAASTLITDHVPLSTRPRVQGFADLTMSLAAAAAGALGGVVVGWSGYPALNGFAAVLALGTLLAAAGAARAAPADPADPAAPAAPAA